MLELISDIILSVHVSVYVFHVNVQLNLSIRARAVSVLLLMNLINITYLSYASPLTGNIFGLITEMSCFFRMEKYDNWSMF